MRLGLLSAVSFAVALAADTGVGQVDQARSFEVASIRLTASQTRPVRRVTNERVDLTNVSLQVLLLRAFRLEDPSRLSAPNWVTGVNVDLHATIPAGSTRVHVPEMLKTLLVTRFGLRAHAEPRPTDVYELIIGTGGVRMQEVAAANELDKTFPKDPSQKAPQLDQTTDSLDGRMRSIFTDRGLITITEQSLYERIRTDRGTEEIVATRMTMGQLASLLSFTVDRPVVDRTGLMGLYRFRIELPPPTRMTLITPNAFNAGPSEPNIASSFKAVEGLGLKLEPRRIMLDTIVVDMIERVPTDN